MQFDCALGMMNQRPLRKIFSPSLGKLLVRRWAQIKGAPVPVTVKLFFGEEMNVILPEVVSTVIHTYGFYDETVTGMALAQVSPGDTVIDIGAHFGYFSLLFSSLAGESGRIYSFEPTPSSFKMLSSNVAGRKNITALNSAVGAENARCKISDFGLKYCAWNTLSADPRVPAELGKIPPCEVEVQVMNLDDYLEKERIIPNLIKIDAENFEFEVITGLQKTLAKKNPPKIIMETCSDASLKAGKKLVASGYNAFVSDTPGTIKKWEGEFSVANLKYKDILFCPSEKESSK